MLKELGIRVCASVGPVSQEATEEGILGKEVQGRDSPLPAKLSTDSSRIQIDSKVNSPFALLPSVQRIWDQGVHIGWTSLTGGNRGNGGGDSRKGSSGTGFTFAGQAFDR